MAQNNLYWLSSIRHTRDEREDALSDYRTESLKWLETEQILAICEFLSRLIHVFTNKYHAGKSCDPNHLFATKKKK